MTSQAIEITPGAQITLHLSLSTPEGFEAITTFGEEPATLVMGDGSLTEGLELALYGLKAGDKQALMLEPEHAFGPRDEGKVQVMQRSAFPDDMELERGLVVGFEAPNGAEVAGIILKVVDDDVTVDFNHPLAGKDVLFKVEILDVKRAAEAET